MVKAGAAEIAAAGWRGALPGLPRGPSVRGEFRQSMPASLAPAAQILILPPELSWTETIPNTHSKLGQRIIKNIKADTGCCDKAHQGGFGGVWVFFP